MPLDESDRSPSSPQSRIRTRIGGLLLIGLAVSGCQVLPRPGWIETRLEQKDVVAVVLTLRDPVDPELYRTLAERELESRRASLSPQLEDGVGGAPLYELRFLFHLNRQIARDPSDRLVPGAQLATVIFRREPSFAGTTSSNPATGEWEHVYTLVHPDGRRR